MAVEQQEKKKRVVVVIARIRTKNSAAEIKNVIVDKFFIDPDDTTPDAKLIEQAADAKDMLWKTKSHIRLELMDENFENIIGLTTIETSRIETIDYHIHGEGS